MIKILFFLLFSGYAYSQSVSWSEKVLIPTATINGNSKSATFAFTSSSGFALQTDITCPGACTVTVTVSGSVDGVTYTAIPELTKTYTVTTNSLFNVYSQHFKWMKVTVAETSTANATIKTILGTKFQI